jgi:hypothetical protein
MMAGLPPRALPPLYVSEREGIDAAEIEQLRIEAIRRCDQLIADLQRLGTTPATLADLLRPDGVRDRLLASVDFDAVASIERAAARLAEVLGEDGQVADPRPDGGGLISVADVQRTAAALTALIAPYREMRAQLAKANRK